MKHLIKAIIGTLVIIAFAAGILYLATPREASGDRTLGGIWEKLKIFGEKVTDVIDENSGEDGAIYHIGENEANQFFDDAHEIYSGNIEKYRFTDEVKSLHVEIGGAVFLTGESEDAYIWMEASEVGKIQYYVEEGILYIRSTKTGTQMTGTNMIQNSKIILYLPKNQEKFASISVELGAGEIRMENGRAEKIALSIGAGDMKLNDFEADDLVAKIGAGNLEYDGIILKNAQIECSLGNCRLGLKDGEESYNYDMQCAMGNITLGDTHFAGLSNEKKIENGAEKTISASCSMGNISICF